MPFKKTKLSSESKYANLLGAFIRIHREKENMSINFMADVVKISKPYLSELEHGKHIAQPYTLKQISKALGVPFYQEESTLKELEHDVHDIFKLYTEMSRKEEYQVYQKVISIEKYKYSYSFLLYYLVVFMGAVRFNENLDQAEIYKDILLDNLDLLSRDDKIIFYDLLAVKYITEKNYQKAYQYLNSVIDEESSVASPMIFYHMCIVNQELNKASEALLYCLKAEELFQKQYTLNRILYLIMYKGNCLTRLGAISTAKSFYLTALDKCSLFGVHRLKAAIFDNLAWNALKGKAYKECISYTDNAIKAGSNFADIYLYKPISFYFLGNYKECRLLINNQISKFKVKTFHHDMLKTISCLLDNDYEGASMHLETILHENIDCENRIFVLEMLCDIQKLQNNYKKLSLYQNEIIMLSTRIY